MSSAVIIEDLTKRYGKRRGVTNVNLEVSSGQVFGFIGPNGSGKTTTIRLLMNFIQPTSGHAVVLGRDPQRQDLEIRSLVGYLPGDLALYQNLTGRQLLSYFAYLRGGVDEALASRLVERLDAELDRPIKALSTGNKQKLGLVQAFAHRPELLILDEPTVGLDPLIQQEFNAMVREVRDEGRTVFLSSHNLTEVERATDRVAIIREGEIAVVEELSTLKERARQLFEIEFASPVSAEAFSGLEGVGDVEVEGNTLSCSLLGKADPLIKAAAMFEVVEIRSFEAGLERIFLDYYQADGKGGGNDAE